jgi:multicomponent Na+:H+ antiporter subunit D
MTADQWILAAVLVPIAGAVLIALLSRAPNLREGVTLITSVLLLLCVVSLLLDVLDGARPAITLFEVLTGLSIALDVVPLGMLFALVAEGLWIVNSLY